METSIALYQLIDKNEAENLQGSKRTQQHYQSTYLFDIYGVCHSTTADSFQVPLEYIPSWTIYWVIQ